MDILGFIRKKKGDEKEFSNTFDEQPSEEPAKERFDSKC